MMKPNMRVIRSDQCVLCLLVGLGVTLIVIVNLQENKLSKISPSLAQMYFVCII